MNLNSYITYILFIKNNLTKRIKIAKLGKINFKVGWYIYVGSARRNLLSRLRRHLSQNKKIFWHIDYFLSKNNVKIKKIGLTSLGECQVARFLSEFGQGVLGFGCSDCNCPSHLFYIKKVKDIQEFIKNKFKEINLNEISYA